MNLLMNNEVNYCVALLINSLSVCHFKKFIECVNKKDNWTDELCWCTFEKSDDNREYYVFETFEDDTYTMPYDEFLEVVKLAIIRFYSGTNNEENKKMLKDSVKNTVFESALVIIDALPASDIPLVYGN